MVRSVVEYSATIWDPHLKKDINSLDKIQRRGARFVKSDYRWRSSVTAMLDDLGWRDLDLRRKDMRLTLLFKVLNHSGKENYAVTAEDLNLKVLESRFRPRGTHPLILGEVLCKTEERGNFFPHNTIPDWNKLPASVVLAPSATSFKTRLADAKDKVVV